MIVFQVIVLSYQNLASMPALVRPASQASKMAETNTITLKLPTGFAIPVQYQTTTVEENSAILLFGITLLERLRTGDYDNQINLIKKELAEEKQLSSKFRESISSLDLFLGGRIDEAVSRSLGGIGEKVERLTSAVVIKEKEEREGVLEAFKTQIDSTSNAFDRRVEGMSELLTRISDLSNLALPTRGLSSAKGRANENDSRQLITDTFGTPGSRFQMHQKQNFSGDHIFDWNGMRIMWEDKDYTNLVAKAEVEKGLRDFEANQDCHVLLFVSAHTPIFGRETSSGIDSEIINGRLVLFISCFKNRLDPASYVKSVIQTILLALKSLILRSPQEAEQSEQPASTTSAFSMLEVVSNLVFELSESLIAQEKAHSAFIKDFVIKLESMKHGISRTRASLNKIVQDVVNSFPDISIGTQSSPTTDQPKSVLDDGKRHRNCGKCGQPGHTRNTCKA